MALTGRSRRLHTQPSLPSCLADTEQWKLQGGASQALGLVSPFPEPVVAPSSVPTAGGTAALGDSRGVKGRKGFQWCDEGWGILPSSEAPAWLPLLVLRSQAGLGHLVTVCQHCGSSGCHGSVPAASGCCSSASSPPAPGKPVVPSPRGSLTPQHHGWAGALE